MHLGAEISKNRGCRARRGPVDRSSSVRNIAGGRLAMFPGSLRLTRGFWSLEAIRFVNFASCQQYTCCTPAVRQTIESFKREWRKSQNPETPDRCPVDSGDLRWAWGSLPRVLGSPGGNKNKYLGDLRFFRFFSKKMGIENLKIRKNAYSAPFP